MRGRSGISRGPSGGARAAPERRAYDKEQLMPYVNIRITQDDVNTEKKEQIILEVTQLLADVLGKDPETILVVLDEVEADNWGMGGETVARRRRIRQGGEPR
jgi:4-oxalocrotonate tautomerase